jgi:hypothetical protein
MGGSIWLRKSIKTSLLASSPNNFLNPKSVYGLMYFGILENFIGGKVT